jgi:hypothetical protein
MDEIFGTTNFAGLEDVGAAGNHGDVEKSGQMHVEDHEN